MQCETQRWWINAWKLKLILFHRYQVLPSGVLLITNVQERDVGNYKCIATNPHLNKKRHSAEASLSLRPPTKQYRPPQLLGAVPSPPAPSAAPDKKPEPTVVMKDVEVLQGEMLSLECAASGYPTPQLVWSVLFPGISSSRGRCAFQV